ncbi:MAG: sodium-dependent transporter [Candidatus Aminicenantes bacterium]|nr:sodium-dependent transporter [Candidatus Aminicenantes bacterium]
MQSQNINNRGSWGSKIAFVFAATGSAIGLGNIWRFPMAVGMNGGAVFVFVYVLAVAVVGFTVMLAELSLGRFSQKNPVGAIEKVKPGSLWKGMGYLGLTTAVFILSYYAVLAGWAVGYLVKTVSGAFKGTVTAGISENIFTEFTGNPLQVLLFFVIMLLITTFIISRGVKEGIEKWTKILMPLLFLLILYLAIRALLLPGAEKGISFYLNPDFSKLSGKVILMALGQAFFSLSLGMGIMVTYGSYINKKDNLVTSAGWVCFSDFLIAFLAGIIIFPTLFAIPGISPAAGPGLVFKVFPLIFSQIPGGNFFGALFFMLLIVAALTSTISLLEVPVAFLMDELNWTRRRSAWIMGTIIFILGVPSALSSGGMEFFTKIDFLGKIDLIFGNISLAVGAFFLCIFVGYIWKIKNALKEIESGSPGFKLGPIWAFSIKIFTPIVILFILYFIKTIAG